MEGEAPPIEEKDPPREDQPPALPEEETLLPDSAESPPPPTQPADDDSRLDIDWLAMKDDLDGYMERVFDEERLLASPTSERTMTPPLGKERAAEEAKSLGASAEEVQKPRILEVAAVQLDSVARLWREGWLRSKEPVLVLRRPKETLGFKEKDTKEVVEGEKGVAEARAQSPLADSQVAVHVDEPMEVGAEVGQDNPSQAALPKESPLREPVEGYVSAEQPREAGKDGIALPTAAVLPSLRLDPPAFLAAVRPSATTEESGALTRLASTGAIPKRRKSKRGKRPKEGSRYVLTMEDYFSSLPTPPRSPSPPPGPAQWPPAAPASRDGLEGERPRVNIVDEEDWDASTSAPFVPFCAPPPPQRSVPSRQQSPRPHRRASPSPPPRPAPSPSRRDPILPPTPTQPRTEHRPVRLRGVMFGGLCHVPTDPTLDPPAHSCFNCWERGHDRRRCPLPTVASFCHNCGRKQVDLSSCPRCCMAHRAYLARQFTEQELIEHERRQRRERAEERQQEELWRRRWQEEQRRRCQEEQLRRQQEEQLRRQQEERLRRQQEDMQQQFQRQHAEVYASELPPPDPFYPANAAAHQRSSLVASQSFGEAALAVANNYWRQRSEEEWRRMQQGTRALVAPLPRPINELLFGPGPADAVERSLWLADQLRGYSPETRTATMRAYYQLCDLQRLRDM